MNKFVREHFKNKSNSILANKNKKEDLEHTIKLNDRSIDYIENILIRHKDNYNYTESDIDKEHVELNEYILFVLKYVGNLYSNSLKNICKVLK